jgi:hypothetical protein
LAALLGKAGQSAEGSVEGSSAEGPEADVRMVNSWVYFSVRERAAQLPPCAADGAEHLVADHVTRLYGTRDGGLRPAQGLPRGLSQGLSQGLQGPLVGPLVVTGVARKHRKGSGGSRSSDDHLESFPDVLEVQGPCCVTANMHVRVA